MESIEVHLHRALDAEDCFALAVEGDSSGTWRAVRGFGQNFQKVWSVEVQSAAAPDFLHTDWDAVLERVIAAWDLNDPVITEFQWPRQQLA
jgi:hypothetical protein